MKKFIILLVVFATVFAMSGTAVLAEVNTVLTPDTGTGDAPIVKAKWEMLGKTFPSVSPPAVPTSADYVAPIGNLDDDMPTDGAQFNPTGAINTYKDYTICAVVTDPDSFHNADIDGVYADIYYPIDRSFHENGGGATAYPNYGTLPYDQIDGALITGAQTPPNGAAGPTSSGYDYGELGCGMQLGDELELTQLTKDDGWELFCNIVQSYDNGDLPTFYAMPTGGLYDYNEICDPTGELMKEEAYVYCGDRDLFYEDPAGDYTVTVMAQDKGGLSSALAENTFTYLELNSFDVDFNSIDYGNVKLNTLQGVSGDLVWDPSNDDRPTVRNLGNIRLYIGVQQDDMGLGTTGGVYNVHYQARVGNEEDDWKDYDPNDDYPSGIPQWLEDVLDLSEDEEMDFTILVTKWPLTQQSWLGYMTLSGLKAEFRQCLQS